MCTMFGRWSDWEGINTLIIIGMKEGDKLGTTPFQSTLINNAEPVRPSTNPEPWSRNYCSGSNIYMVREADFCGETSLYAQLKIVHARTQ